MCVKKIGIGLTALVCYSLFMAVNCDLPKDEAAITSVTDTGIEAAAATTSFRIGHEEGVIDEKKTPKTIKLTVPYGTDLASLAPEIVFSGVSVSPASGVRQDFTDSAKNPLIYTVTGRDGSSAEYQASAQPATGAGMIINVTLEGDIAAPAPSVATIYKDGNPAGVTVEAAKGITCKWFIDGKPAGTNAAITLDAANLTTGDHFVTLLASKNGIPYSREYVITVVRKFR
jgi:hypothetical protein